MGRLEEAEASYNQAIALKPDFTDALEHRWKLLFDQKRYEAALKDANLTISDEYFEELVLTHAAKRQSEEAIEGLTSFAEKRDPSWYRT